MFGAFIAQMFDAKIAKCLTEFCHVFDAIFAKCLTQFLPRV
jgi:hypothetical protein